MITTPVKSRARALDDLTVIEFGEGVAAAYGAKLLADLGATAIKIERPEGDPTRARGPFPDDILNPEASGLFAYLNTNKLGVTVDIDAPDATERFDRLLKTADIFVTDVGPEILDSIDCFPAKLRERYPDLIIATISPFGMTGPWKGRIGDELTAFASSGLAYGTPGIPDAAEDLYAEPPLHPSCFPAETLAGLSAATAIMAAVAARHRSGPGCHIDLSAQGAAASIQVRDMLPAAYGDARFNRLINPVSIGRMPNFYLPCKDGHVTVAAPMDVHWDRVVAAMGRPEWALSASYASEQVRQENWEELRRRLSQWTLGHTSEELMALGETYKVMIFPFYSISRVVASEHVACRGSLTDVEIGGRSARMPAAPFHMSATPWRISRAAPKLGQHNADVFQPAPLEST